MIKLASLRAHRALPLAALMLSACGVAGSVDDPAAAAQPKAKAPQQAASAAAPVLVELFQSQGCSSCPPANANVNALAGRPNVLALSFGVTYWDRLGWKDSFAQPAYTQRQWDYARHAGRGNVATPQVIINGKQAIVGSNAGQLDRAIASAGSPRGGPAITTNGSRIQVGAGGGGPSTVWLVRYDPRVRDVAIRAGENGGRTLPHRNVVRQLVQLGDWVGKPTSFALPRATEPGLRGAIFVQRGLGGPITATRRIAG